MHVMEILQLLKEICNANAIDHVEFKAETNGKFYYRTYVK